jgi:hypothetical protein
MTLLAVRTLALDGGKQPASQSASIIPGTHWTQKAGWAPRIVSACGEQRNTRLCREFLAPAARLDIYVTDGGDAFSKQCYSRTSSNCAPVAMF